MKTKNIFRMLLVAAALLMGANNVKADTETTIWEGTFDENGAVQVSSGNWKNNLSEGDKLRIYVSNRLLRIVGAWTTNIGFVDSPDGYIDFTKYNGEYFEAVFNQSTIDAIAVLRSNPQWVNVTVGPNITVSRVTFVDSAGEEHELSSTSTTNGSLSFDSYNIANAVIGNSIKIYATISDVTLSRFRPYYNDGGEKLKNTNDGWVDCSKTDAITGYVDYSLTSQNVTDLANGRPLYIEHEKKLGIKRVSIVSSTSTDTRIQPTLSFGQTTVFNITFGDSFTGPIATCDPSSLQSTIIYETSNQSVAAVVTHTGEVEIKGAGQAVITARTGTETLVEYKPASASYTINVAKVNYTLSYSASTATAVLGQSWTAPTLNNPFNITVTYSSTNTGVATIDENGNVTVVGTGQTTIKANYAGDANHEAKEASYVLTVSAPQPAISFSPDEVNFVFGGTYEAPTVTKTPADASVTYTSDDINVAIIDGNGNVVPVGEGSATITGTLANTDVSATNTLNVTAPSRDGAVWTGAEWLGSYGRADYGGGKQPSISTSNLQSAQVGDAIRFYGKLGPLGVDHNTDKGKDFIWRVEVHGNNWAELADINSADSNNSTDNANFQKGYFDMVINNDNISNLKNSGNLTLNGHNLTITAVELISASAPAKQDVTLTFSPSTATATMGEAFTAPTLTATANNQTITGLTIIYSSSNTDVATVDSNGDVTLVASGTTVITASFNGDDNYNAATASYTLTVSDYIDVNDGNIGTYGYRTYVTPHAVDFSRSIGVEAYFATGLNTAGTKVEFTEVTGVCAAGVPLLLKKKTGATAYKLQKSTATATATTPTGNKLKPGPATAYGPNKYVLTIHSGEVVFAEVNINSATVDEQHAYLDLSGSNARGRLSIQLNSESTGIQSLQSDERSLDRAVYNLRGQRVEHPTKGIYIINGKKVIIK